MDAAPVRRERPQPGPEIVPGDLRALRACLFCSLLKTARQFEEEGCENCGWFLEKIPNIPITSYTTSTFDGAISMMQPTASWVAKWQRINNCVRGCYAIQVHGTVPDDVMAELTRHGVKRRPRNAAVK